MRKSSVIFNTLIAGLATLFCSAPAFAADIEWSGLFRLEGNAINNSEMRGSTLANEPGKRDLDYGLTHLILRPKINAGDGFAIYGQFDIFNSYSETNSQMGLSWGSGVGNYGPASDPTSSNSLARTQKAGQVSVSELFLTYSHEFGQLIAGRAPLQFGLGMTYSAGRGLFDHWHDTRDMVGYKIVMGNLSFLPMFGKVTEGNIGKTDDIDDYMIQVQYDNPESDIEMGVFYLMRHGSNQASDTPLLGTAGEMGGVGATDGTSVGTKQVNIYVLKDSESFRGGLEAAFMSGETGILMANKQDKVTWGGFGLAGELELRPQASKWKWGLKAGMATGDDPSSDGKFEGFTFNRNYDVAMLLFNHVLGEEDYFRTRSTVTGATRDSDGNITRADVEAISNVMYLAPSAHYQMADKWSLDNTLVTGWLETSPFAGKSGSKEIGYEWDISTTFSPRKGVQWITGAGLLLPGAMWKTSSTTVDHDNRFVFGLQTKAAISF